MSLHAIHLDCRTGDSWEPQAPQDWTYMDEVGFMHLYWQRAAQDYPPKSKVHKAFKRQALKYGFSVSEHIWWRVGHVLTKEVGR